MLASGSERAEREQGDNERRYVCRKWNPSNLKFAQIFYKEQKIQKFDKCGRKCQLWSTLVKGQAAVFGATSMTVAQGMTCDNTKPRLLSVAETHLYTCFIAVCY